jgi:hypothetical protein
MMGTHFFTVSQNNVVAVNFQSIGVLSSSISMHSFHAKGTHQEKNFSSLAWGNRVKQVEILGGDA